MTPFQLVGWSLAVGFSAIILGFCGAAVCELIAEARKVLK